ncbi:MAG: membrane protein insertion efficiency factor YidD [Deltaproteobacteria bacterium]|nr:membrane protein insertion efficiency factor YidD [Deltaproteobacteria bacterium]MBW1718721.1 membrane protein insertion efficiency factor YidD [Deltaproteobacteria bacterium]MBW1931864.1 membrane protein insertion efficiency factor YidD [Deltaproteobacteria bacterium]MBW1938956.1 membrane protein insertion efficiency factor YidD [Deltaproteobacteria bacterium]MBW1965011.1 membrane protein insertion efficiency factor YidD [Deltaproteobacteria bacterium]
MLSKFIIFFIRIYRLLFSPILPRSCRFFPSCSQYAEEAIVIHGPIIGIVLAIKRLLRCHPWTPGGYDPVP